MGTTADKLALLQRTKAGQRALLEEMYPDLDFSTVPFREYGRLFTGRKYVPGFVGGWKAYGRSNNEPDGVRNFLTDYSGNGRDIELFNFAFAGMSGYGGYPQDFSSAYETNNDGAIQEKTSTKLVVTNPVGSSGNYKVAINSTYYNNGVWKVRVNNPKYGANENAHSQILARITENSDGYTAFNLINGINTIPVIEGTIVSIFFNIQDKGDTITFEVLPDYPGALVSDGVDDYGQCIKGFALPDDYTVVAIRKILSNGDDDCLAGKSLASNRGAFIFEYAGSKISSGAYSYTTNTSNLDRPALFSWQNKASYNEQVINVGTGTDDETDVLFLFKKRESANLYAHFALYDLRIYDHTLTAEELQTVKDEMMADYENATGGGIADITYVADWDGKGRSNDEEADVRSKWIDKATGKVINLSNYAYSQMSGWGGYQFDWTTWSSDIAGNGGSVTRTKTSIRMTNTGTRPSWTIANIVGLDSINSFRIRVSGLTPGKKLYFAGVTRLLTITEDGIYTIPADASAPSNYSFQPGGYSENENTDLLIEQLPYYPGALVSDGVDDYGQSAEAISEEIGTVVVHGHFIDNNPTQTHYLFTLGVSEDSNQVLFYESSTFNLGKPLKSVNFNNKINFLSRTPASVASNSKLVLFNYTPLSTNHEKGFLSRLIFIKEQLDDTQLEFLKWKVGKEYRDWCKENGYDYAIDEMLNN